MPSKVSQTAPSSLNWQSLFDVHASSQVVFPFRTTHLCPGAHVTTAHDGNVSSGNFGTQVAFPSFTTHFELSTHNVKAQGFPNTKKNTSLAFCVN